MRIHAAAALAILLTPVAALAQSRPQPGTTAAGPLVLERIDNGVVLAPDVKATSFDGQIGTLLGFSGGWLQENALFIGGAGYWLVDGSHDRELGYGGLLAGWNVVATPAFTLGGRALVGWGTATLGSDVLVPVYGDPRNAARNGRNLPPAGVTTIRYSVREDFFAFEPQAIFGAAFSRRIRLNVAAGYRFTGDDHALRDRVEGVTATVGVQFRVN
jgi:hypothetical protein